MLVNHRIPFLHASRDSHVLHFWRSKFISASSFISEKVSLHLQGSHCHWSFKSFSQYSNTGSTLIELQALRACRYGDLCSKDLSGQPSFTEFQGWKEVKEGKLE
ncbi:unnamed protein product [Citrullus colocynthis]|uniref:Uncharacterized protein n=1 Tax=Citrullus colocynthis TaxID=252529 RepID=A0ABP0YFU8_9ROSI